MKQLLKALSFLPGIKTFYRIYNERNQLINEYHRLNSEISTLKSDAAESLYDIFIDKPYSTNNSNQINKEKPLIVTISSGDAGGGANIIAYNIHQGYIKKGYNAIMLTGKKHHKSDNTVKTIPQINNTFQKAMTIEADKRGWLDFFNLSTYALKHNPYIQHADIIHLHNLHGNFFSLYALPEICKNKKVIWTLMDLHAFTGHCGHTFDCDLYKKKCAPCKYLDNYPELNIDNSSELLQLKKYVYKQINPSFICLSNWLLSKTNNSIINDYNTEVIYPGINKLNLKPSDKPAARKELKLPIDKKILISVANLGVNNPYKGTQYLNKIIDYFNKNNQEYLFINIGGNKYEENNNLIKIPYINSEKELQKYYAAADMLIHTALYETFGLIIAEAHACERPVVAFDSSAMPEQIKHKKNGYLAEPKNVKDFIDGIFWVNDNIKNLTPKLQFPLEEMQNQYINLIEKTIADKE